MINSQTKTLAFKKLPNPPSETAALESWAVWNATVGAITGAWKVFPCVPKQKKPLHTGWQRSATNELKKVESIWLNYPEANVGLAIQPGFVAIDADVYKDGATEALDIFENDHGRLPDTYEARTPRGGYHLIYKTNVKLGNGKGSLPNFGDVRGYGGLVVGAGSIFEGKRYTIDNLVFPVLLPELIEKVISASPSRRIEKSSDAAHFVIVDDPRNCEHFRNWCAGKSAITTATPNGEIAKPCIEGHGGNNLLAATGAFAKDYGLSADVALEIALTHFNPRCAPPWDDDDFEKHFRSGYKSATGQLGNRAPVRNYSGTFKPVARNTEIPSTSRFQRYSIGQLRERVPPAWLLDNLIPEHGYTILYGPPGTFKTFLAISIALSVATGTDWHGWKARRGRVLYCMGEGSFDAHDRISAWLEHHGQTMPNESFEVIEPAPMIGLSGDTDEFISEAVRGGKWDLVVVDTIGRTMAGVNDNVQDGARSFTAFATKIRNEVGAATLAITHSPKEKPEVLLGSGAYEADADVILNATVAEKGKRVDLRQHKQKYLSPWDKRMGFRAKGVGKTIVLELCEATRGFKDKAQMANEIYEGQFIKALSICSKQTGQARWTEVASAMLGMNEIGASDSKKVHQQISNWFRTWPSRARYVTETRGAHNAVILQAPTA